MLIVPQKQRNAPQTSWRHPDFFWLRRDNALGGLAAAAELYEGALLMLPRTAFCQWQAGLGGDDRLEACELLRRCVALLLGSSMATDREPAGPLAAPKVAAGCSVGSASSNPRSHRFLLRHGKSSLFSQDFRSCCRMSHPVLRLDLRASDFAHFVFPFARS